MTHAKEAEVLSARETEDTNTTCVAAHSEDRSDADGLESENLEAQDNLNRKFESQNAKQCWELYKK